MNTLFCSTGATLCLLAPLVAMADDAPVFAEPAGSMPPPVVKNDGWVPSLQRSPSEKPRLSLYQPPPVSKPLALPASAELQEFAAEVQDSDGKTVPDVVSNVNSVPDDQFDQQSVVPTAQADSAVEVPPAPQPNEYDPTPAVPDASAPPASLNAACSPHGNRHVHVSGTCECRKHMRWWQKISPWNWSRKPGDGSLCQRCLEARLRAMSRMHPPGTMFHAAMETQISNGDAAEMVVYDYDFLPGQASMSRRGRIQLSRMVPLLQSTPHPLIVQWTPDKPGLAEARRQIVLGELQKLSFPVPDERVIVSEPPSRGLDGLDAVPTHLRLMQQQSGSVSGAGAGTGTAGDFGN